MIGSVNTPGVARAELDAVTQAAQAATTTANEAKTIANEAKQAVQQGGVPIDSGSTITFSLGCDANGVYMVTPDETPVEGGAE